MEQYFISKELDFEQLRFCLDHYSIERVYIRDCGGYDSDGQYRTQGIVKIDECLQEKLFDFVKDKNGLHILLDAEEVFSFPLKYYDKGFSLAYERVESTPDAIGKLVLLSHGVDPYDSTLPEPRRSILRNVFDNHLIELTFTGRVHLAFHSWMQEPHWKYWSITTSKP